MLQPYEVFDAPTGRLQEELRNLEANMVNATAQQTPGLLKLRSIIEQELEERGGAEELFDGLQELEDFLGSAGAYLEQLDQDECPAPALGGSSAEPRAAEQEEEVARSPSSTTSFGPTVSSRTHSPERGLGDEHPPPAGSAVRQQGSSSPGGAASPPRVHAARRGPAGENSGSFVEEGMGMWGAVPGASNVPSQAASVRSSAASGQVGGAGAQHQEQQGEGETPEGATEEGAQEGEEAEEGQTEAAPPKVFLTPVEAAMLAYKEERRQLAKARKARDVGWGYQQGGSKAKPARKDVKVSAPGTLPWMKSPQKPKRISSDGGAAPITKQQQRAAPEGTRGRSTTRDGAAGARSIAKEASVGRDGRKPTALEASRSLRARVEGRATQETSAAAQSGGKPDIFSRAASARAPSAGRGTEDHAAPSPGPVSPRAQSENGTISASSTVRLDGDRIEYSSPFLHEEHDDDGELPPEIAPDRAWEEPEEHDAAASSASDQDEEEPLEAPSLDEPQEIIDHEEITSEDDLEEITSVEVAAAPGSLNGTWGQKRSTYDNRRDGSSSNASGSIRAKDPERIVSAAGSYMDPSDEDDDEGDDDYGMDEYDDFEIYDDPDDGQSDSDIDTSRGNSQQESIGYVGSVPEPSVGGPTRITMRPDSADDAIDRRYVSALADFGVGGDANGGVSAWGDGNDMQFGGAGDYNKRAAGGAGAAVWGPAAWLLDDSDEESQDPVAQPPMLGYDTKPGLPIVGPLANASRPSSNSPKRPASRNTPLESTKASSPANSDAEAGSTSGSPAKPPVVPSRPKSTRMQSARGQADRRPAAGPSYHYTYSSFAEIFTEFSNIQENAQLTAKLGPSIDNESAAAGHSSPVRAASPARPGSRPNSGRRHDSGAVWDRTQKTTERCCRWLEHHRELWPSKDAINDGIARSSPHHVTRWFRVACSAGHPEVFNVVSSAMRLAGGWEEDVVDGPSPASSMQPLPVHVPKCYMWNLMWTWSAKVPVPYNELMVWQKVNHFPDARQLTRKDLLKRHLHRHHRMLKGTRGAAMFNIMPPTFNLPKEYSSWVEAFGKGVVESSEEGGNLWIIKPVGLSRGRGISIASRVDDINHGEHVVIQKYVPRPLLIDGYKFDIRLYVLVTSFNPLEAWLYKEGFARFASEKYTTDPSSLDNLFVHLTNSSIQKDGGKPLPERLVGGGTSSEPYGGSKCSLTYMWKLLEEMGIDRGKIWNRITEEVLAALFAVQGAIPHNSNSFELYGFDVLITRSQKVWLIEANSSPSMGCDTPIDDVVKPVLVRDIISVVEPPVFDRVALAEVLQRRLTRKGRGRGENSLMSGTDQEERNLLNQDLNAVLGGKMPREYGIMPETMGAFDRIAPSKTFDEIKRLVKHGPRA